MISGYHQTFQEQMTGPVKYFVKYFYDYALRSSYAVRDALNLATIDFFQTTFTSSILNTGYNAWWPGGDFPYPLNNPGWYPRGFPGHENDPLNRMRVFGDGSMWVFQPKITLTTNCEASPTFYLNGEPHYAGDIHVWPEVYTFTVSDIPNYVFDHFSYHGYWLGRPATVGLYFDGELKAYYNWNPTYYTLSISSSGGGHTNPTGDQQYLSYSYAHVEAVADPGWVLDHWQLGPNNMGSNPTIDVYMDAPHTLQAVFVPAPSYQFVSSISGYDGPVYSPNSLVGWQPDGQFAEIDGYGPYYYYGWISGAMNAQSAGHIYMYGYGDGPLYVYVSSDGYNWNYVTSPYVNSGSPYWIDCGSYLSPFNYIAVTAEDPNYFYSIALDSVRVDPPVYHTLTISSGSGGSTTPSPGAYQYAEGTPATVTANPNSGYVLDYWLLDGQNAGSQNPITVTMNGDHTLQANFRPGTTYHWLTVDAYDGYFGNPLYPGIYIDGNLVGYGYASVQVTEDWHTVLVEDPVWNDYIGSYDYFSYFTDGYGNGASRPVYSDTYTTAIYYPW